MKAALYVRTSTVDQTVDNQVRELEAVAERLGHEIVEVYADNGISGAKGRDRRPAFDRLCRDASRLGAAALLARARDRLHECCVRVHSVAHRRDDLRFDLVAAAQQA